MANALKQKLNRRESVHGSSVRLCEPGLCELLGIAGFDFVVLDGEHGTADGASLERMILGCLAGGTAPIARVLDNHHPEAVMKALDLGAHGILMPHIRTADDATRFRAAATYPPRGNRGFGPGRGARWGRTPVGEYLADADQIVLIGIIEDVQGIENIDAIAAAGLDVLWLGTGDLSFDYGVPGEVDHPLIQAASQALLAACLKHGVAAGTPVRDAAAANAAGERGFRAFGYGGAEQYVMQSSRRYLEGLTPGR